MKLVVRHNTSEYRGDHAADVCRYVDLRDGETVLALASRLLSEKQPFDSIWIQLVDERAP